MKIKQKIGLCENHRVGYKTLVQGLNRNSSISIQHYDAQNESDALLAKENRLVFESPKLLNKGNFYSFFKMSQ